MQITISNRYHTAAMRPATEGVFTPCMLPPRRVLGTNHEAVGAADQGGPLGTYPLLLLPATDLCGATLSSHTSTQTAPHRRGNAEVDMRISCLLFNRLYTDMQTCQTRSLFSLNLAVLENILFINIFYMKKS